MCAASVALAAGKEAVTCLKDHPIAYPQHHVSQYAATKTEAERRVLAASSHVFHTVALRIGMVYGRGDELLADQVGGLRQVIC